MRISTAAYHASSLAAMLLQQTELSKTQNQMASGKRVNSPADDPIATAHILELERAQSESAQFGKNSDLARSRGNLEEQAVADSGTLLQRVRELVIQASNTATLTPNDRVSIATELDSLKAELGNIANRKDGGGEYLFSGYSTLTQPFSTTSTGNTLYSGDQGSRLVQIGPSLRIADGHSGFDVFMKIPEGNGLFWTTATGTNTGSGLIDTGTIVNRGAWVRGDYSVHFIDANTWEVLDSTNAQVATGAYTSGSAIAFNGIQVSVSGIPATNDTFTVKASGTQDVFTMIDGISAALQASGSDSASTARLSTVLENGLQQIDQSMDHLLGIRSQIGARLSQLDNSDTARDDLGVELASTLSNLRDLDYAEAMTRMTQQLTGLQAAQASYAKISQLSLFNYL